LTAVILFGFHLTLSSCKACDKDKPTLGSDCLGQDPLHILKQPDDKGGIDIDGAKGGLGLGLRLTEQQIGLLDKCQHRVEVILLELARMQTSVGLRDDVPLDTKDALLEIAASAMELEQTMKNAVTEANNNPVNFNSSMQTLRNTEEDAKKKLEIAKETAKGMLNDIIARDIWAQLDDVDDTMNKLDNLFNNIELGDDERTDDADAVVLMKNIVDVMSNVDKILDDMGGEKQVRTDTLGCDYVDGMISRLDRTRSRMQNFRLRVVVPQKLGKREEYVAEYEAAKAKFYSLRCYDTLELDSEVPERITKENVDKKYRELARKYHPDRNIFKEDDTEEKRKAKEEAPEKFKEIGAAKGICDDIIRLRGVLGL
jgi:hypothetical protein